MSGRRAGLFKHVSRSSLRKLKVTARQVSFSYLDLILNSYAHLGGMIATAPGSPATNVANSVIAATLAAQSAVVS